MRILIVTGTFHPEPGGPSRALLSLGRALVSRGDAVRVITFGEPAAAEYPFPVERVSRRAAIPLRLWRMFRAVLRAGREADLLFVNDHGLAPAAANVLLRKPLVMKVVGDFAWEFSRRRGWTPLDIDEFQRARLPMRVRLLRAVQASWVRRARVVVVPSAYLAGMVKGWGVPAGRIRVVPNAIDRARYAVPRDRDAARAAAGLKPCSIVTVARLAPWKGVDHLIGALSALPEPWRLVVVGDGPDRARLETLAREAGAAARVRFTGEVPQESVPAFLRGADIVALYSGYEGLSHVLLEALIAGAAVVASNKGGNPEVIRDGENGLLVPWPDPGALVAALARLTADGALRERLARAAAESAEGWNWDRLVAAMTGIFAEAVEG